MVVLALLVWLLPADLALALSVFEPVCTMSCADTQSCCCKPGAAPVRGSKSGSQEMSANGDKTCRPDCAPATIVVQGNWQGRTPVAKRTPSRGTGTYLPSTVIHSDRSGAPLDRFASRAPPHPLSIA